MFGTVRSVIFTSKYTKMRLTAGLCPDPLEELQCFLYSLSGTQGKRGRDKVGVER